MIKDYIKVKTYKAKKEKKILFFFPAGFTKMWQYRYTVFLLNRMGITVVGFDFAWNKAVSELDMGGLIRLVEDTNAIVLNTQLKNPEISEYVVFGTSFGTVCALYAAKRHESIRSIILNMPYGTLAHLLWTHKPSKPFKEMLIKSGIDTEEKLYNAALPIETQADLDELKDRKIVNFTAMNDKIVFDGDDIAKALKKANPKTILHKTQFGHFWGGIENIMRKSKWDRIL